jgi:hypothetical protein
VPAPLIDPGGLLMSPSRRRVNRLAACRKRLHRRLMILVFGVVWTGFLGTVIGFGWGLLVDGSGAWPALIAVWVGGLVIHLTINFVVFPDVELFDRGLVVRVPGRKVILPWDAVIRVVEGPRRTRLILRESASPLHRLTGLLVGQRQPVILLNREAGCYRAVAGVLRDMLPADRFVTL